MTSTRAKKLARAIQRANPGMKYTEALRSAESLRLAEKERVSTDPTAPHSNEWVEVCRAAGIDMNPIDVSGQGSDKPLDPTSLSIRAPMRPAAEVRAEAESASERLKSQAEESATQVPFDPNSDFIPPRDPEPEPRLNYVDKTRPVHDLDSTLWDGETHPDPLTFLLGHDLRTKESRYVSLNGLLPHILISGNTASGKSSIAEIVAAQALTKPMPWDPTLFGTVMILDSTGVMAWEWAGRRGVIAVDGSSDAEEPDQDGNPVPGERVMASALERVEAERERRAAILARHGAGTWADLPDAAKREERLAPLLVIFDEYMNRGPLNLGGRENPATGAWEDSRRHVESIARKGRAFGIHLILTSRKPDDAAVPFTHLTRNAFRVLAGDASNHQLTAFFGPQDVPALPTTREVLKDGARSTQRVLGRARIMEDTGQEIGLMQTLRVKRDRKSLDKWLPRGDVPPNGDFTPASGAPRAAN